LLLLTSSPHEPKNIPGKVPRFFEIHGTEMSSCAPFVMGLVPFAFLPGALYNESAECSQTAEEIKSRRRKKLEPKNIREKSQQSPGKVPRFLKPTGRK
jgi:hypothetical protein